MFLHEIVRALERIERNQVKILERLKQMDERTGQGSGDKWLQDGIDSILSYQAGKGRKEE